MSACYLQMWHIGHPVHVVEGAIQALKSPKSTRSTRASTAGSLVREFLYKANISRGLLNYFRRKSAKSAGVLGARLQVQANMLRYFA